MDEVRTKNKLIAFVGNSAWSMFNFRRDVFVHLASLGYKIVVIASDDQYSKELAGLNITFIPVNFNNRTASPLDDIRFYKTLKSIYRKYQPQFVFHYVAKPNIYGSFAATSLKIQSVSVITGLGYAFAKRNWLFFLVKNLYRRALRQTREVWFLNNEDAKVFITEQIVDIGKMKILPGEGINTRFFSPVASTSREGEFNFLMSARLLKSKGVSIYADAARIIQKKHLHANFHLIGFFESYHPDSISPADLEKWQAEGLITYHGMAGDVRSYLGKSDCFVFPSYYNEGIPRSLMEAASMQIPIITSLNRGCKEIVRDNMNGFLCNINDPFDLADKMEKMIRLSREERLMMGVKGREHMVKNFDISLVLSYYDEILGTIPA